MLADDRGSVTAEFAIVLPAALLVLGLAVGSIMLATQRLVLSSTAAELARHEARGDQAAATATHRQLSAGVTVQRGREGALHCVTLSSSPVGGLLSAIKVSAKGCAAVSESAA